jgi:hypothetical protein
MSSAAEQQQIIITNDQAFEELKLLVAQPQIGEVQPDLQKAIRKMGCGFLSVSCYSCTGDDIDRLISGLQNAASKRDHRDQVERTEEAIPSEIREKIKALYSDPHQRGWMWDRQISLYSNKDAESGHVATIPLKHGRRFEYRAKPPLSHNDWAIIFSDIGCPRILVKGSLHQAKRKLDLQLGADTPGNCTIN